MCTSFTDGNGLAQAEAKAVVSVTVEGSVGLVKAMVRLGASVGEAIASVVERYAREGRSPCLDPAAACSRDLPTSPLSFEPSESSCTAGFSSGDLVTALQCMHASICTTCKKCKGFREADGEPGSRTCSWAPMASPRPHSPSSITLRKSTKINDKGPLRLSSRALLPDADSEFNSGSTKEKAPQKDDVIKMTTKRPSSKFVEKTAPIYIWQRVICSSSYSICNSRW
ncbi:uncharacterized protein [Miscanthus floridulus]|uniref:uncharacterized protein isoform X2 n=1 Tax=Miscanthus floridulus TaxID=154761 RepID=UPI003458E4AB